MPANSRLSSRNRSDAERLASAVALIIVGVLWGMKNGITPWVAVLCWVGVAVGAVLALFFGVRLISVWRRTR